MGVLPDDIGTPAAAERHAAWSLERERELRVLGDFAQAQAARADEIAIEVEVMRETLEVILAEDLRLEIDAALKTASANFKTFRQFAEHARLPWLPAHPETVASYLLELGPDGMKAITRAVAAISREHNKVGHPDPCDDVLVRAALRWLRRQHQCAKVQDDGPAADTAIH
jgi:hypothetical protein